MGFKITDGVLEKYIKEEGVTNVVIPEGVTKIADYAFKENRNIKSVTIPYGVECIGDAAFCGCSNLEKVEIPESVTEIGYEAFLFTNIFEDQMIEKGIVTIGHFIIDSINENLEIDDNITHISETAFDGAWYEYEFDIDIKNIKIGKSFTDYSKKSNLPIFYKTIENIEVSEENPSISSIDGVLFNKDKTELIKFPSAKEMLVYNVPDGVKTIKCDAFTGSKFLKEVNLPNSVVCIETAFMNGNIEKINITENIKEIAINTFDNEMALILNNNNIKVPVKFISKGKSEVSVALFEFIINKTEENFKKIKKVEYKIPLALYMIFNAYDDNGIYKEYIKKYIKRAVEYLIDMCDMENFVRLLSLKFITAKNIDELVLYANEQKQTEMQIKLMNYKNEHIGYKDIEKQFNI